ncbi:bifunctional phosphoribosyl-AMP cyclohydrolase/phosphoribosyl-ATP diphosphatase HisIE [soil metagenome]
MSLNFSKGNGLLPAVIQDELTGKVLMLGFMNEEAYLQTLETKKVTFFSRSKNRLWVKGETSGNFLHLRKVLPDCDNDTLLIKVNPVGPACHTGADTCFKEDNQDKVYFLDYLKKVIRHRKTNAGDTSYTGSLFKQGINKIAQKVGEEAVELVIEAMDQNDNLFKEEAADLLFHFLVLLEQKNVDLNEVISILENRHKP